MTSTNRGAFMRRDALLLAPAALLGLATPAFAEDDGRAIVTTGLQACNRAQRWVDADVPYSQTSYYNDCYDYCSSPNNGGRVAGWAIAGLVQASGFVMWMVGMGTGPEKIERFPLRFSAAPTANNGMQFGMNGKV